MCNTYAGPPFELQQEDVLGNYGYDARITVMFICFTIIIVIVMIMTTAVMVVKLMAKLVVKLVVVAVAVKVTMTVFIIFIPDLTPKRRVRESVGS
jgi:hypothetical protein